MYNKIVTKRELDATLKASELGIAPKVLNYQECNIQGDIEKINSIDYENRFELQWYYITTQLLGVVTKLSREQRETILDLYIQLFDNNIVYYDISMNNIVRDLDRFYIIDFGHALTLEDMPESWYPYDDVNREQYMEYTRGELGLHLI